MGAVTSEVGVSVGDVEVTKGEVTSEVGVALGDTRKMSNDDGDMCGEGS
jgi:hypothetical protein